MKRILGLDCFFSEQPHSKRKRQTQEKTADDVGFRAKEIILIIELTSLFLADS